MFKTVALIAALVLSFNAYALTDEEGAALFLKQFKLESAQQAADMYIKKLKPNLPYRVAPYEVVVAAVHNDPGVVLALSTLEGDWYPQFLKLYGVTQEYSDKINTKMDDQYWTFRTVSTHEYCVNDKLAIAAGVSFEVIFQDDDGKPITGLKYNAKVCK